MNAVDLLSQYGPRDSMEYDVVIVGAGVAGLSAAIRIKQLAPDISVVVLEKGAEVGAHTLSGAVLDPRALNELIPDWQAQGAPIHQAVTHDAILFLSNTRSYTTPQWLVPDSLNNHGNYIVSLGAVTQWLAQQAENLGVDIFAGFAATEVLYDSHNAVRGVATGNMGVDKNGQAQSNFQLGVELLGKYTFFAEGARGQLSQQIIAHYQLDTHCDPASYAIGIKELWEVPQSQAQAGLVVHTSGYPLQHKDCFGGGFLYHLNNNQIALGLVLGLNYSNPYLSPFEEMQRWKTHPAIAQQLAGGKRIGYGARALNNGGLQALPQLAFAGGVLLGCAAGFMNAARIKGSHAAMKSGMLAAEAVCHALQAGRSHDTLSAYPQAFKRSWLYAELQTSKNFKQWYTYGNTIGTLMTGIEQWLLPKIGIKHPPWTLHNRTPDYASLKPAASCHPIQYDKPDGILTFDRMSSVYISNTHHEENQPSHLTLKDSRLPVQVNLSQYAAPEAHYCPAGVYEYIQESGTPRLQINAQNCIHCKTCDIKDPRQNIVWIAPEGGGGPNYGNM